MQLGGKGAWQQEQVGGTGRVHGLMLAWVVSSWHGDLLRPFGKERTSGALHEAL
jgi:hypothetical protein